MKPSYIPLFQSGELAKRAESLWGRLESCDICPRGCMANRLHGEPGYCNSLALPIVSSFCSHHGEEPVLSGKRGSGTIFFGNCNMHCLYCQNHLISQNPAKQRANEVSVKELAKVMLSLQDESRCHNINLVSPTHFVPHIIKALLIAIPGGLRIPLVYNTNSYDKLQTLQMLDNVVDIYLADLKYADDDNANKYSDAPNYSGYARGAIKEMHHQTGNLKVNEEGIAIKGLIVRHLVLPGGIAGSSKSLSWLGSEVSKGVYISLMSQYHPCHKAINHPLLGRVITENEYAEALSGMKNAGLERGWQQEIASSRNYLPDFNNKKNPFG